MADLYSNNQYSGITERGGIAARQLASHQHRRVSSLEVIEGLSTPSSPTPLRRERNRPGAVQSPLSFGSTGSSPSSAATRGHPFTLPPRRNMSLSDGIDLLECMRVFQDYGGYAPAVLYILADGPYGGERFEVYVTHLNHSTSITLIFWAARPSRGQTCIMRVAQDLVSIGGGFADRLLRHWDQTHGRLRHNFDVTNTNCQAVFADSGFANEFFLEYRHEFAKFMGGIRLADVEARYITQHLEREANLEAIAGLTTNSHGLAPERGVGVEASTPSSGFVGVGGLEGGPMDWIGSEQSRSGQARDLLGTETDRDTDPIVVDDDDE